jgi:hypothetical protein
MAKGSTTMSAVKLEDEVRETRPVEVVVRRALYAQKCDGCGRVFRMKEFCNDAGLGQLDGTFEECATEPVTDRRMGNGFSATACSFACAHDLFEGGKWKTMRAYKPFADAGIRLARAQLKLTCYRQTEAELRAEWAKTGETKGAGSSMLFIGP